MAFCQLDTPKPKLSGDGTEYSVQITISKDHPQVQEIVDVISKQKEETFPDIDGSKLKICLRDNDAEGNAKKYDYLANTLFFNAKRQTQKGQVPVFNPSNIQINPVDSNVLFSGCICNVVVNFYTYNHPTSKGITASIEAVQIVKNHGVERRDGQQDVSNAFEAMDADEAIDNYVQGNTNVTSIEAAKVEAPAPEEKRDTTLPWG